MTLLVIAAALAGWSLVVLQDRWLDDLEDELATARHGATASDTETAARLDAGASDDAPAATGVSDPASAELKLLKDKLEASKADQEVLRQHVRQAETALKLLRAQIDEQARAAQDAGRAYRTVTRTRLRAGPSTDTKEVAVMVEGAGLRVIDEVADGTWYEVRVKGYAFHELLTPSHGE